LFILSFEVNKDIYIYSLESTSAWP